MAKAPSPSFRAVEKLGMENPELDAALKSSGIMQLGYDPSVLVQEGRPKDYERTNLYGAYIPDPKDTQYEKIKQEAEARGLDEAVYVGKSKGLDRYIESMGEEQTAELYGLKNKKELQKLNEYLKSDDYLRKTMFEEFFHRGMTKELGEDLGNREQDLLMAAMRLREAPKKIKPLLEKYITKMEGGLPNKKAYELLDKYEALAKEKLKERYDVKGKYAGGFMDKPLYDTKKDIF